MARSIARFGYNVFPAGLVACRTRPQGAAMANVNQTVEIEGWIQRLQAGDDSARQELLNCACERLTRLTRKMLKDFGRVKRWEQTDDVVQNSLLRLYRTLAEVPVTYLSIGRGNAAVG